MILSELERPITSQVINKVLQEQFNYEMPMEGLTPASAKALYEDLCKRIDNFRNTSKYLLGEKNAMYLSMLATAKFLTEYMREKKTLLEKEKLDYNAGIGKALGHGVNTAKNFVPHVAGSALGAFVGGLKGQALQSEHGKVKITSIDLEKEMKDHFGEYKDPKVRKTIGDYLAYLKKAGESGQLLTPEEISAQIADLPGKPFAKDLKPKKLAKYFFNIYEQSKKAKETPKTATVQPVNKNAESVTSALINLGYKRPTALKMTQDAISKNPEATFDQLLRGALNPK